MRRNTNVLMMLYQRLRHRGQLLLGLLAVWLLIMLFMLRNSLIPSTPIPSLTGAKLEGLNFQDRVSCVGPAQGAGSMACVVHNVCLSNSPKSGVPPGWFLFYNDAEFSTINTPVTRSMRSAVPPAQDPLSMPVRDTSFSMPSAFMDPAKARQTGGLFRVRTGSCSGESCVDWITPVRFVPGRTWVMDWALGAAGPNDMASVTSAAASMFAVRNVTTHVGVPEAFDHVVYTGFASAIPKFAKDLLQTMGVPVDDGVIQPTDPALADTPFISWERLQQALGPAGSAVCFEQVFTTHEADAFASSQTKVCPVWQTEVLRAVRAGDGDCVNPSRAVFLKPPAGALAGNVVNDGELLLELQRAGLQVQTVTLDSTKPLADILNAVKDAGVVVSVHGQHELLASFAPKGAVLVELFPWKYYDATMHSVVTACGLRSVQMRSSELAVRRIKADDLSAMTALHTYCNSMTDLQCMDSKPETRRILQVQPFEVDPQSFQDSLVTATALVHAGARPCVVSQQQLMQAFIPGRDAAQQASEYWSRLPNKFTVYLSTFDRDRMLKKVIAHYAESPMVDKIIVSWNNIDREPPTAASFGAKVPLVIIREKDTSMNNRFLPHPDLIRTECVFNVDDDILVPLEDLAFGFSVWQQYPDQLVGFLARSHTVAPTFPYPCDTPTDGTTLYYSADCKAGGTGGDKTFWSPKYTVHSMVLDSACLFHVRFLHMYTHVMPAAVRHMVDETRNCEDIALPMLMSHHTGKPGVYVSCPKLEHLQDENEAGHHPGLNKLTGHYEERTACITDMSRMFGYPVGQTPLLYSNFKLEPVYYNEV